MNLFHIWSHWFALVSHRKPVTTAKTVKMGPCDGSLQWMGCGCVTVELQCWLLVAADKELCVTERMQWLLWGQQPRRPATQRGRSRVRAATSTLLTCTAAKRRTLLGARRTKEVQWEQDLTVNYTPVMSQVTAEECLGECKRLRPLSFSSDPPFSFYAVFLSYECIIIIF